MAGQSVARSAGYSVASMAVTTVGTMDACSVASKAEHWVDLTGCVSVVLLDVWWAARLVALKVVH